MTPNIRQLKNRDVDASGGGFISILRYYTLIDGPLTPGSASDANGISIGLLLRMDK